MPFFGGFAQARNFGKGGAGKPPGFNSPAGSLGSIRGGDGNAADLLSAAASTGPGDPPIQGYSLISGSMPPGLTFNTSTAAITGTPNAVSSDTTYNFTVRATSSAGYIDRAFSITIRLPVIVSFTTNGGFTWNVPTGVQSVDVVVVGGGGSGGNIGGGGGGGGVAYAVGYPVTPGGSVSGSVGDGGGPYSGSYPRGNPGQNSNFGQLTGNGGGHGGGYSAQRAGGPGGCSGGSSGNGKNGRQPATQPGVTGQGGGTINNYGQQGGPGVRPGSSQHFGAGGGGANGQGQGVPNGGLYGGAGIYLENFTAHGSPGGHFAGGGGGGMWTPHLNYPPANQHRQQGGTGGGGRGRRNSQPSGPGNGVNGTGGGAGGLGHSRPDGNNGGSGGVFIRY